MDESSVRADAQTHADATVAGDFKVAGSYLTSEAAAQAGGVMKQMPRDLNACEVTTVQPADDGYLVEIRYRGESGEAVVESRWADRDGAAKIVGLQVRS
ncbi:MAG TPA: hypothetical protein VNC78_06645 [Actinomycetota bacterium]|nr:hypothetical protein [Actinomycetota bacterium]